MGLRPLQAAARAAADSPAPASACWRRSPGPPRCAGASHSSAREVVAERTFRDHHRYRPRDLEGLAGQAPLWVTTEKDAVKLLPLGRGVRVVVLVIELAVDGQRLARQVEARLRGS